MKKLLVLLSSVLLVFGVVEMAAADIYNFPRTAYMGGFGDSWATYWGQSFVAEPGLAQTLTFELRYQSGDGDLNFRLLLTIVDSQWNGVDYSEINPGIVLFESEPLALPHNSDWMLFSVELGGIDLQDGQTYAFVLDAFEDGDGVDSKALVGLRDGYQDGHIFWLGYSKTYLEDTFPDSDRDYYFNNIYWQNNVDHDMAFSLTFTPEIVSIDIKPISCPNPLNDDANGKLTVAILGTADLDVTTIDPFSVSLEGVEPIKSSINDVSTPVLDYESCECNSVGGDGYEDLIFKFSANEIVDVLGEVQAGEELELTLTGSLTDGTPIEGYDCVVIVSRGNKPEK